MEDRRSRSCGPPVSGLPHAAPRFRSRVYVPAGPENRQNLSTELLMLTGALASHLTIASIQEAIRTHASSRHQPRRSTPRICSDVATSEFEAPELNALAFTVTVATGKRYTNTNGNRLYYDKNNPLTTY